MWARTFFSSLSRGELARLLTHVDSAALLALVLSTAGGPGGRGEICGALSSLIRTVHFEFAGDTRFDLRASTLVVNICGMEFRDAKRMLEACSA